MLRPLGLPPGSVRALLLIGLAIAAILDLRAAHALAPWLAAALVVGGASYFSARAATRSGTAGPPPADAAKGPVRHPLFLPAGTVRTILLVLLAYGTWVWLKGRDVRLEDVPVGWVLGAFVLGVLLRWLLTRARQPEDEGTGLFWHLEALVALACVAGLVALRLATGPLDLPGWVEPLLAAGAVFYFGSR